MGNGEHGGMEKEVRRRQARDVNVVNGGAGSDAIW